MPSLRRARERGTGYDTGSPSVGRPILLASGSTNVADGLTFVDTNVLLYAHDRQAGQRHEEAVRITDELWQRGTGALSTQVLQEFYVNATRKLKQPISRSDARDIVADYATWRVQPVSARDVLDASLMEEQHTLSFWDALIVVAAMRTGAAVLLSEDLQDGRKFGAVTVRNPFDPIRPVTSRRRRAVPSQ
jgi:predicted nucleic acid-binding protein